MFLFDVIGIVEVSVVYLFSTLVWYAGNIMAVRKPSHTSIVKRPDWVLPGTRYQY